VYDTLTDLKRRHIVSSSFIDHVIEAHRAGHAGYYGYVIWDLVMLESWFSHHVDGTAIAHSVAAQS
jgi:asparagine synthase (glutamine-hydrolysing)